MGCGLSLRRGKQPYRALPVEDPSVTSAAASALAANAAAQGVVGAKVEPVVEENPSVDIFGGGSLVSTITASIQQVTQSTPRGGNGSARVVVPEQASQPPAASAAPNSYSAKLAAAIGRPVGTPAKQEVAKVEVPPVQFQSADAKKAFAYIASLKDSPPDWSQRPTTKQALVCLIRSSKPLIFVGTLAVRACQKGYEFYKKLPLNVVRVLFGLGLCFFGGIYFTAIAAVEAARFLGGAEMMENLNICWQDAAKVVAAQQLDDEVDADNNGIPDVEELEANDLLLRKAKVALMAIKEPDRVQMAVISLINVYLAVIATLKVQFARTVAIALGIAEMVTMPATRTIGPFIAMVVGPDLKHWVPCIVDTLVKVVAVMIATYIQAILSAFYSGLRGGRMVATGMLNIAAEKGWAEYLPESVVAKPFDPDRSNIDEFLAYPLAAVGFYMQFTNGFALDFPFNVILLPLTMLEWILRMQVYT